MSDTTVRSGSGQLPPYEESDGPFLPGARVGGRYTIERKIGFGGMGVVYRARQDLTSRSVALKVLRATQPGGGVIDRFLEEIRLLGRLEHHGLAAIHDADLHARSEGGDLLFFTMELVDGVVITKWVEEKRISCAERLSLMARVCEAMQYAHDHGVIHCDLKPANILVRRNGDPVVIDFGLAYLREDPTGADVIESFSTIPGDGLIRGMAGTPCYMSPEQFQGSVMEIRAGQSVDVYALGVVTFELLTGRLPYDLPEPPTLGDLRRAVLVAPARRLLEFVPDIDPELDSVVAKALRKDPADRYFSVTQFLRALNRFLPSSPQPSEGVWRPAPGLIIPSTNWILDEKLGEGGVGEVWTCHHRTLKNKRIVKFCVDEEKASLLRRELTLYKLLKEKIGQNSHFARLEEVALEEPPFYLMSEFIEALDFAKWVAAHSREAPIPEPALLEIVAQAADALQAAHDAGVIHRDIKPSNLLLRGVPSDLSSLHVWVGDFGIGQVISDELLGDRTRGGFTRTVLGGALSGYSGTHTYLAPEIQSSGEASLRSDIYSLGVVLYQALAGDFHRVVTIDWASDIPDPLLRADLEKCFARDPAARFPSAGQLADRLRRIPERRAKRELAQREAEFREQRAYHRGLARAGAVAAAIIALVAGLGGYAYSLYRKEWITGSQLRVNEMRAQRLSPEPNRRNNILARGLAAKGDTPAAHVSELRDEFVAALGLQELAVDRSPSEHELPGEHRAFSEWGSFSLAAEGRVVRLSHRTATGLAPVADLGPAPESLRMLAVTDDGLLAVAVGATERVIWDRSGTGATVRQPAAQSVTALAVHPAGCVAFGLEDGRLEVFEKRNHWTDPIVINRPPPALGSVAIADRPAATEPPWTARARQLAFNPQGDRLAVVSDGSLWATVWEVANGALVASMPHGMAGASVAWDPDGTIIATGTEGGDVQLWRMPDEVSASPSQPELFKQAMTSHETGGAKVHSVQFHARGNELYVRLADQTVRVLRAPGWRQTEKRSLPAELDQFVLTSQGGAAAVTRTSRVLLWEAAPQPVFTEAFMGSERVRAVSLNFDREVVAAAIHSRVGLLKLPNLDPLGHQDGALVSDVAFHQSEPQLYVSNAAELRLWLVSADLSPDRTLTMGTDRSRRFKDLAASTGVIAGAVDGSPFVALALGAKLELWVKRNNKSPVTPPAEGMIDGVTWCPRLGQVAVVRRGADFVEFHTVPKHEVVRLDLPGAEILAVAGVFGGEQLAIRTRADVRLVALPEGRELSRLALPAPEGPVPLAVSGDGSMVATEDSAGRLVIVAAGADRLLVGPVLRLISNNPRPSTVLSFGGSDECSLIVGTQDGYVQVWHLRLARSGLAEAGLDWTPALAPASPASAAPPVTKIHWVDLDAVR